MALAIGRRGPLWEALRARAERAAGLAGGLGRSSPRCWRGSITSSPHALFAEALGPLGGRARLFARLGPEAAEPVDELLNAALAYSRMHPPSLQGFLHWLRRSGAEVKREAGGAGEPGAGDDGAWRQGTAGAAGHPAGHHALPPDEGTHPVGGRPGHRRAVPIWSPRQGDALRRRAAPARRRRRARRMEEHNRLLYVALTRAEDRLVVCGWQTRRGAGRACWYRLVERGFDALPARTHAVRGLGWRAAALRHAADCGAGAAIARADPAPGAAALPPWAGAAPDWQAAPPPAEPARPGAAGAQPTGGRGTGAGARRRVAAGRA